jgi:hypothetical protein
MIRFLTGRPVAEIPYRISPSARTPIADYPRQIAALREEVMGGHAVVVHFNLFSLRGLIPSKQELEEPIGLPVLHRFADATVYGVARDPAAR